MRGVVLSVVLLLSLLVHSGAPTFTKLNVAPLSALRSVQKWFAPFDGPPASAQWMYLMRENLANMTPPELTLPGTHDSGAYYLSNDISPGVPDWLLDLVKVLEDMGVDSIGIVREWAITQYLTVYQQLLLGARFIDLRACWDEKNELLRTLHFLMGDPFENLLRDIKTFVQQFPNELVILQFGDFSGMNDTTHQQLLSMIENYLGPCLYPRTNGFADNYASMMAKGQRVVAFYDADSYLTNRPWLWSSGNNMPNQWANVDNFPAMLPIETTSVQEQTGNPQDIYKLQWLLTASAERIIKGIDPFEHIRNLHDLSRDANGNFDAFLNKMNRYRINLLMTDFMQETTNVESSRIANMQDCNDIAKYRAFTRNGDDCRSWAAKGMCFKNSTVQAYCPLSCGLCPQIAGKPGDNCTKNSDCIFNICNINASICLTDAPRTVDAPCGANFQCWSGICSSFQCALSSARPPSPSFQSIEVDAKERAKVAQMIQAVQKKWEMLQERRRKTSALSV